MFDQLIDDALQDAYMRGREADREPFREKAAEILQVARKAVM